MRDARLRANIRTLRCPTRCVRQADQREQEKGRQGVDQRPCRTPVSAHVPKLKRDAKHEDAPQRTQLADEGRVHAFAQRHEGQGERPLKPEDTCGGPQHAPSEGGGQKGA